MANPLFDEFVSHETRNFRWHIGSVIASSLAGFLAGVLVGAVGVGLIFWAFATSNSIFE